MKTFHVKLPSVEYQDFLIDKLKKNTNIPEMNEYLQPGGYPCFLVVRLMQTSVDLSWNLTTSSTHDEIRFEDIEELIVKHFDNHYGVDDSIFIVGEKVIFNENGSITIGCTTVIADTLDKIYKKLHGE